MDVRTMTTSWHARLSRLINDGQRKNWVNGHTGTLEFPANNAAPLVQSQRKVSVRSDPLGIVRVHGCLRCGADGKGFMQVVASTSFVRVPLDRDKATFIRELKNTMIRCLRLSHPRHLCRKALDVLFFLLEVLCRNEHGKVRVLDAQFLDLMVNVFYDRVYTCVRCLLTTYVMTWHSICLLCISCQIL